MSAIGFDHQRIAGLAFAKYGLRDRAHTFVKRDDSIHIASAHLGHGQVYRVDLVPC